MGRHLVDPLGHAGVEVTREDRHRPAIVARALLRIPRRGVAAAVVEQVGFGIVRVPAPRGAAADLPLLALPGIGAGGRPDRLAEMRGLHRVDQRVAVRAHRISAPHLLAVLHVVRGHRAADAELAARNADDDLVLVHVRRRCAGLALGGIAVLHRPHHLAGLRVERDDGGVGLMQEDLAVRVGDAAIHRVAAHHRNDVRILLRLVLPDDLVLVLQVERIDDVREWGVKIHRVADHERIAFVAAQHAGRKRPGHLQLADVLSRDLLERGVPGVGKVARRYHPLLRVFLQPSQFFVCACGARGKHGHGAQTHRGYQLAHRASSLRRCRWGVPMRTRPRSVPETRHLPALGRVSGSVSQP